MTIPNELIAIGVAVGIILNLVMVWVVFGPLFRRTRGATITMEPPRDAQIIDMVKAPNVSLPVSTRTSSEIRKAVRTLPVLAMRTCDDCAHFDLAAGQHEMEFNPNFRAATISVPPWRMGRVLKKDDQGKDLPIAQQGIDDVTLSLRWNQCGACLAHKELRFSPQPACERFEQRTHTPEEAS